jgi:N-methylhydantoinase A/oxoprolinase/acetone carboxylase beta subunit
MSTAAPVLGVDVGGTNTDAVIMVGDDVIAAAKRSTTADVGEGLIEVVQAVLEAARMSPASLASVMIGTTQFINAFVQRRDLTEVAAVRIALPKTDGIPPMVGWPDDLTKVVGNHSYLVGGGSFYDGREYEPRSSGTTATWSAAGHFMTGGSMNRWIRPPWSARAGTSAQRISARSL